MTDDEKRHQKALLLVEYEDAAEDLAHLVEAAKRKSAALRDISDWFLRLCDSTAPFDINPDRNKIPDFAGANTAMKDALEFGESIGTAMRKVSDLRRRKESLGIKQ